MDDDERRRIETEIGDAVAIDPAEFPDAAIVADDAHRPAAARARGEEQRETGRRRGVGLLGIQVVQRRAREARAQPGIDGVEAERDRRDIAAGRIIVHAMF